jgi:hypothetical protein
MYKLVAIAGLCTMLSFGLSLGSMAAGLDDDDFAIEDEVFVSTNNNIQMSTITIDRRDLRYPHTLQIQAKSAVSNQLFNKQVTLKVRGKSIALPTSGTIDLAPYLTTGRNQIDISATTPNPEATISLQFKGRNSQVSQSSSGTGKMQMKMTIDAI